MVNEACSSPRDLFVDTLLRCFWKIMSFSSSTFLHQWRIYLIFVRWKAQSWFTMMISRVYWNWQISFLFRCTVLPTSSNGCSSEQRRDLSKSGICYEIYRRCLLRCAIEVTAVDKPNKNRFA
jgi:hypothetical protein